MGPLCQEGALFISHENVSIEKHLFPTSQRNQKGYGPPSTVSLAVGGVVERPRIYQRSLRRYFWTALQQGYCRSSVLLPISLNIGYRHSRRSRALNFADLSSLLHQTPVSWILFQHSSSRKSSMTCSRFSLHFATPQSVERRYLTHRTVPFCFQ